MEDIIAILQKAKYQAITKDWKVVDTINEAIKACEKKAAVIEAMLNPIPGQPDLLPAEGNGGAVINAENVTINMFFTDPPHPGNPEA